MTSYQLIPELQLKHPSRIIIFGPSGSGKTSLVEEILINSEILFGFNFENIIYVSGQGFPSINEVNGIEIYKMRDIDVDVIDDLNSEISNLMIFDDNIYITNDKLMSDLFTKLSHHKNVTVILMLQNLFPKTRYSRDISINSSYILLMHNPRESSQIKRLSEQIDGTKFIYDCYKDATTNKPYSYLVLDFNQETPEHLRVRSNLFPNEMIFSYVKKEK